MTNIKENIQHDIRNYLYGSPLTDEHIEYLCEIVRQNFESYPSAVHPDSADEEKWADNDFDVDMAKNIYDN